MAENLNVSHFRNGDPIPEARTINEWLKAGKRGEPVWCYKNNDPVNEKKYGKLYNWYVVNDSRGLAPEGWLIPTDKEWTKLSDYLGGEDVGGIKMKATCGWYENGNGTNESAFTAFPGGCRYMNGFFYNLFPTISGFFWSSSKRGSKKAWFRYFYYSYDKV